MEAHARIPALGAHVGLLARLPGTSDERLARLVAGDAEAGAFTTLYERYHQPLYRYCRSLLGHDGDAQDALQSTFAAAYSALRRGRRDAPVRPWLYRIAHNESVSLLRGRKPATELSADLAALSPTPEQHVEQRHRLATLVADLGHLPERQRGALVMRELSGLSHEDIALALDSSVGAAKQTIFEARRSLAEFAEGRAMSCDEIRRATSDADGRALRGRRMRAHLRDCAGCAGFADSIADRRADLRVLAPALPALAAGGLLLRVIGATAGHGHGGGAGGIAAGAAGKTVAATVAAKTLGGVAVLTAAAVGVSAVAHHDAHTGARPAAVSPHAARSRGAAPALAVSARGSVSARTASVSARTASVSARTASVSARTHATSGHNRTGAASHHAHRATAAQHRVRTTYPATGPAAGAASGSAHAHQGITPGRSAAAHAGATTRTTPAAATKSHGRSSAQHGSGAAHSQRGTAKRTGAHGHAKGSPGAGSATPTSPGRSATAPGQTKNLSISP